MTQPRDELQVGQLVLFDKLEELLHVDRGVRRVLRQLGRLDSVPQVNILERLNRQVYNPSRTR